MYYLLHTSSNCDYKISTYSSVPCTRICCPSFISLVAFSTPTTADWIRYRNQWEYAHAVNAIIKIIGFGLLVLSVIIEIPKRKAVH
jgi:hypothetical protein